MTPLPIRVTLSLVTAVAALTDLKWRRIPNWLTVPAVPMGIIAQTIYGDGFYYIAGTQTCIKIGGFVRAEVKYHAIGSFEPAINGANAQFFRAGDPVATRARAGVSFDVREQTEYGTLRAYLLGGWQYTSNDAPTLSLPGTAVPRAGGAATLGAPPNGANNVYFARA